eukprot:CAMPEP_0206439244 /NCGR_PEP_ID=MMETSP0324_2-20121206/12095_1 /ASSEMBLY_ACC=CAM_ASM_000836 /TAXON_ID=2866 /ORGANISM="Crypthecodinium cohnii, Strain Seligo" /LENGTH=867 /DNA_ID=CAMNT_0053906827 /DNA_START=166 /DNA_END=2765 /DNA_ORIENTATION=+
MGALESRGRANESWEEESQSSNWGAQAQGKKGGGAGRNRARAKQGLEEEAWGEEDPDYAGYDGYSWYEDSSYKRQTPQGSRKSSKADKKTKGRNPHQGKTIAQAREALVKLSKAPTRTAKDEEDIEWLLAHISETLSNAKGFASEDEKRTMGKELSEIMTALGSMRLESETALAVTEDVVRIAQGIAEGIAPGDIAGLVYGFACLPGVWNDYYEGCDLEKMLKSLAKVILQKKAEFGQWEISTTAWAYAKCSFWDRAFVDGICDHCRSLIWKLSGQSMANICWALAQWSECEGAPEGWTSKDKLLEEIVGVVKADAGRYRPPALSMVAWSFARLNVAKKEALAVIAASSTKRIQAFSLEDLVHLSWGLAYLQHVDVELFRLISEVALALDWSAVSAAELANLAWAFAKSRVKSNKLMQKIVEESSKKLRSYDESAEEEDHDQFQADQITMLTWALAAHGLNCSEFMKKVGDWATEDMHAFTVEQLAHIAWSFAALRVKHEPFFDALCTMMVDQEYIEAHSLANIVFACAQLHYSADEFLSDCDLGPEILRQITKVPLRALVRAVWAFDAMGIPDLQLTEAVAKRVQQNPDGLPTKVLAQFYDVLSGLPEPKHLDALRLELEKKLTPVVDCIRQFKLSRSGLETWPKLLQQLSDYKIVDCGLMGTQFLEQRLDLAPPNIKFIKRCSTKDWSKTPSFDSKPDLDEVPELYTAIQLQLSTSKDGEDEYHNDDFTSSNADGTRKQWADEEDSSDTSGQEYEDWIVKWCKDPYFGVPALTSGFLRVAELVDRAGRCYPTAPALEEVCFRIQGNLNAEFGTQSVPESCESVRGEVNIFTSLLPSVACLCAIWQFKQIFPNVTLTFVESVDMVP